MAPPKKLPATTLDASSNFFQRGKKSTIPQRVVNVKKHITPTTTQKQSSKDNENSESDHIDDAEYSGEEQDSQHSEKDESDDLEDRDEIQSNYDSDSDSEADLQLADNKATQLKESISSIKKPTEITKTKARKPLAKKSDYVAPYVGDIYAGFHQADISETEKFLRQFDLASKYGPCTELTRLERWERAFELGLDPPQNVKDTLVAHMTLNTPVFEGRV
ncbi:hypothetical protein BGZ46_004528 [Entomortierella lignicola]|nr:hypothetical protein BGZ46_004528 [Entomortierella lignicola]